MDEAVKEAKRIIAERMKRLRKASGLGATAASKRAKQHRTYVYQIEKGIANPSVEALAKLTAVYGVPFDEFLTGMRTTDIPEDHEEYYVLLKGILNSEVKGVIRDTKGSLEAFLEKANRLRSTRNKNDDPSDDTPLRRNDPKKRNAG
jgi:transcriptional regulator with XRE-family HTH domain